MLAEVPIILILVGLTAYAVLAFADFGAGVWTLLPGGGRADAASTRDFARHSIGPVWEANHVWLVFVLVVCWTAYPVAFGSITSTLAIPLFIAAVGIILRGSAYALRGQLDGERGQRAIESVFALSSILVPFALGTVAGAIASGRVPVGNARGDLVTSWLNPTSVMIGVLSVVMGAYLAAVYLAADARRLHEPTFEHDFRVRALASGILAGALALAGLLVVRSDSPYLWHGFSRPTAAAMIAVSGAAGLATIALVWRRHFESARVSAALAVATIIAGWAFAQRPRFLPGLTIEQAAAGHSTLIAVVVSAAIGAIVLVPALVLLFGLFLRGRLDSGPGDAAPVADVARGAAPRPTRAREAFAVVTFLAGVAITAFAEPGWARAVGVICLVAAAMSTFALIAAPDEKA